jgi:hypothetical protein
MSSSRQSAAGKARVAGNRDDLVTVVDEPGDTRSADQPGRPGHEHACAMLTEASRQ